MKRIIALAVLCLPFFISGCSDKGPEKEVEIPRVRVVSLEGSKVDDNLYFPAVVMRLIVRISVLELRVKLAVSGSKRAIR